MVSRTVSPTASLEPSVSVFTSFLSVQLLLRLYSRSLSLTSASNYVGTMLTAVSWVITFAIAGNIALSLGMIGALSVVRFRTPVKSPVDLVNFFYFVTLGIAFSTRILSGVILFVGFVLIASIVAYIDKKPRALLKRSTETYANEEEGKTMDCLGFCPQSYLFKQRGKLQTAETSRV